METEIKAALQLCVCSFMYKNTNKKYIMGFVLFFDVFVSDLKFANYISKVTRIYFYR